MTEQALNNTLMAMAGDIKGCQIEIIWLKLTYLELMNWLRIVVGGVAVSVIATVYNSVVLHKNGKKDAA